MCKPIITPLSTKNVFESVVMHIGMDAVDQIVRSHNGPRVGLTDCDFEGLQVNLT